MGRQTVIVKQGGLGFLGFLTLLFIALKFTGYITWAWWIVLLPLYGVPAACLIFMVLCYGAAFLIEFWELLRGR